MMTLSKENLVTRLIILCLGLLFLLPAGYKLYAYCVFRCHAIAVDGVVSHASRGRDLGSRPFVEYSDLKGNVYETKSKAKTHWFYAPQVGEKLTVYYDERDPTVAIVDSTFHYVVMPLFFFAAGACFLFYAIRGGLREVRRSN
jgi:hypothetical protein